MASTSNRACLPDARSAYERHEGAWQGRPKANRATSTLVRAAAAVVLLGTAAVALPACPANSCFLKICTNGNCRCSISSCTDGAAYDLKQKRCRCVKGFFSVGGQCLSQRAANAYCGPAYTWVDGQGCLKNSCRPGSGDFLDESTGQCIPKDVIAKGVGAGQTLGCKPGERLVVEGGQAACVPAAQSCARDESWSGSACVKVTNCPTGAAWDAALGQCVTYVQGGGDDEAKVDVQQWVYTNYGPPNAHGSPGFCATFAKKPWAFGITAGNTAMVRVTVNAVFPDREVAKGQVATQAAFDHSGSAVPPRGQQEVDAGARTLIGALVAGGGRASAPSATTTVRCPVTNASAPEPVPATGGF